MLLSGYDKRTDEFFLSHFDYLGDTFGNQVGLSHFSLAYASSRPSAFPALQNYLFVGPGGWFCYAIMDSLFTNCEFARMPPFGIRVHSVPLTLCFSDDRAASVQGDQAVRGDGEQARDGSP
jgi:hypothetical protein